MYDCTCTLRMTFYSDETEFTEEFDCHEDSFRKIAVDGFSPFAVWGFPFEDYVNDELGGDVVDWEVDMDEWEIEEYLPEDFAMEEEDEQDEPWLVE